MAVILESNEAKVIINNFGAELSSFVLKETGVEYIWQADPEYWGRHAPVLFPFVGRLKDNQYTYKGKSYSMGQHGFARDKMFDVIFANDSNATFELKSSKETYEIYPFDFTLRISYELRANELIIGYYVTTESDEMYFSIGGHPAFNVPLTRGTVMEDYYLHFDPSKTRTKIPLVGPFIDSSAKTLAQTNTSIQLTHDLFIEDAQILETKGKNMFSILSDKHKHGVMLRYDNFPYVGFWSPYGKNAPFVCIEPWCGIADDVSSSGNIEEKIGIIKLTESEDFSQSYSIKII